MEPNPGTYRKRVCGSPAALAITILMLLLVLLRPLLVAADTEGATIVAVELVCEAPIDKEGLRRLIPLRVGARLRQEDLDEAERRLKLTEVFTSVSLSVGEEPPGVAITISLVRKLVLNSIRLRGNETFSDNELRRVVRMQEGSSLTDALRDYGVQRLREHYIDQGFPDVAVRADVQTLAPGEVNISFAIDEGAPLIVSSLAFVGDLPISTEEAALALSLKQGSRYSKSEVQGAEKELRRLLRLHDYYEAEVDASWELSGTHAGRLVLKVEAGPRFELIFTGNRYLGDQAILELVDLTDRPIITDGTWREMARRAQRAYQAAGYFEARVTTRVETGALRRVAFEINEGAVRHVGSVRFEGNRGLTDRQLRAVMATRPPAWWPWNPGVLVDETLDEDLKRMWFEYRRHGFLDAEILDARHEIDPTSGDVVVVVIIREGPQTLVAQVARSGLDGIDVPPSPELLKPGDPLDSDRVEAERQALVSTLFKAGYATARVDARVATEAQGSTNAATVFLEAHPGDLHRVGDIFVQNNIDTRARVLLRELPFRKGDPLDPDALLLGQSHIYKLGFFRTVSVRPLSDGKDQPERDIAVNVSERFPGTLQWGAGYNTRDGIRGFAEVGYSNLQGSARRVSLRGDINFEPSAAEPDEYLGNLGFLDPRVADTHWIFRLNLVAQRSTRSVDQFSIERLAALPAIERPLLPGLTAGFEIQAESSDIFDVKSDVLVFNPRDEGHLVEIGGGPYAVYDGRDDPFQPTRGAFTSLRAKIAPAQFGTDIPFAKLVAQHSQYVPLLDDLTFVYAARLGWAKPFRSNDIIPIRERFFLGGRTTVRGFAENGIGPEGARIVDEQGKVTDKGGNPLGGDLVMSSNVELRFPIAFGLGGAAFFDAGGVYLQQRQIRVEDLRESAGLGLRYATPVGPIGLDYGFKVDRRRGESIGEVHFSIGTMF